MNNDLTVLTTDALRIGEAIATAATGGSGSATLEPVAATVAGKTFDVAGTITVTKGTAPSKPNALQDGLRMAEALATAFASGSGSATLDPFGFSIAGESLVVAATFNVTAK